MTCSLYAGTLVYHPTCVKGYSYYYNDCCNLAWYHTWNVLVWVLALFVIFLMAVMMIRINKRIKARKQAKLVSYEKKEELLRSSEI